MGRALARATSLLPAPRLTLQPCQRRHGASSMPPCLTSLSLLPAGRGWGARASRPWRWRHKSRPLPAAADTAAGRAANVRSKLSLEVVTSSSSLVVSWFPSSPRDSDERGGWSWQLGGSLTRPVPLSPVITDGIIEGTSLEGVKEPSPGTPRFSVALSTHPVGLSQQDRRALGVAGICPVFGGGTQGGRASSPSASPVRYQGLNWPSGVLHRTGYTETASWGKILSGPHGPRP